jgi:hypothetical protein
LRFEIGVQISNLKSQISNFKSQIKLGAGENGSFYVLTREGVFEGSLNIFAVGSSMDVTDGELVDIEG